MSRTPSARRQPGKGDILKPFGFCCSADNVDPLTRYNRLSSLCKSSLMSVHAVDESPTLKFRAEFTDHEALDLRRKTKQFDSGDHKRKKNKLQSQLRRRLGRRFRSGKSGEADDTDEDDEDFKLEDLHDKRTKRFSQGPINWYLEDETEAAKDSYWEQRQRSHNEEMDKNTKIGKRRTLLMIKKEKDIYPNWYQDFSNNQIQNLRMLQCIMHKDCEEMVTGRTQRTLMTIGIISTFFTLSPDVIKKLQESTSCTVIDFLREIYKILTGRDFEEEGYKKFYDCNERIILSAIAFLTLPEAIVELHKRLPPVKMRKIPPKPTPSEVPVRRKKDCPYEDGLFVTQDWSIYYNSLQHWREKRRLTPIPHTILPPKDCIISSFQNVNASSEEYSNFSQNVQPVPIKNNVVAQSRRYRSTSLKGRDETPAQIKEAGNASSKKRGEKNPSHTKRKYSSSSGRSNRSATRSSVALSEINQDGSNSNNENGKHKRRSTLSEIATLGPPVQRDRMKSAPLDVPPLYGENRLFDFTLNGICEKPGPVEYKICGVLQPPQPNKKSWLDEKHAHYIISGASDEPPTCPVTYEMTGIANVTPSNSDERFFAVLKLGDGPKKIYPSGRKNLSRHWQEWLQCVDEEFRKVEREANKMIKSIEAVTKLVFPEPTCDSCCSCRQTRKSYLKAKETKAPYFVIDTIAEDDYNKGYIVGSMAMHSPAPTPPESTVNLLEVIASEDVLTDNVIISGVTNETGETQYFITGSQKEVIRMPGRVVEPPPPRPPRNVPPCVCTIQQIFNKGLSPTLSHDNIPWTKDDGLCFGKKFRPHEAPAYSCKLYPGDKSCRRSPFMHDIMKLQKRAEKAKQKEQEKDITGEKKMYGIADFQPCGDEHGMGICGGPWGALHTLSPEELEELEKQRKEILRGPPCGTKPGRAVCEGPFGARVSPPKATQITIEEEIPGEEDVEEEDEEEEVDEEEKKKPVKEVKEKEKKRDKKCHMSPEAVEMRRKITKKEVKKFTPDPTYPGYDDPWNIFRTAPSQKESETDFKKLLKLSSPKSPATPAQSKTEISEGDQPGLPEDASKTGTEKDTSRASTKDTRKGSPTVARSKSEQISKKGAPGKTKSEEKMRKSKSKMLDKDSGVQSSASRKIASEMTKSVTKVDKAEDRGALKSKKSKLDQETNETSKSSTYLREGGVKRQNKTGGRKGLQSKSSKLDQKMDEKQKEKGSTKPKPSRSETTREQSSLRLDKRTKISKQNVHEPTNYERDKEGRGKGTKKQSNRNDSSVNKRKTGRQETRKKSVKRDKQYFDSDVDLEMSHKNKVHEFKNMMKSTEIYPYDVQPAEIPEDTPGRCKRQYEDTDFSDDTAKAEEDADIKLPGKGPCGWRTKSEQKLSTKKTLVYLTEPDYPAETVAVGPGGKPCLCRENRATKKILLYNIGGLIGAGGKKEDEEKKLLKKKKEEDKQMQVIDGVIYYTPPPSPRRSDEYVPEYDLYDSPYDMCLTQRKDRGLKYLEHFGKPKIQDVPRNKESCGCNEYVDTDTVQKTKEDEEKAELMKEIDKTNEMLINAKPPKERWNLALKDVGLLEYFTRCRDNLPCWLKCAKFNYVGCPIPFRKLKTKRPVCECKYERKILEHREEKQKWKDRQKRLKSYKKQPYVNVADISKPLIPNTKLMISGVKRIPRDDEYVDDVKYCITGVAENYSHLPPKQVVAGIQMATPIQTPEPSEEEIPCVCLHRHWSPAELPAGPLPKPAELELAEKKRRQEAVKEAFQQIYAPQPVYHTHDDHGCKETCGEFSENEEDMQENGANMQDGGVKKTHVRRSITDKSKIPNPVQLVKQRRKSNSNDYAKMQRTFESKGKGSKRESKDKNERSGQQKRLNAPQSIDIKESRDYSVRASNDPVSEDMENVDNEDVEHSEDTERTKGGYMMSVVKIELKKMSAEGFLFAKLPKSFLMPQLRYWLMYRKGFTLSDADKRKSVRKSVNMWDILDRMSDKTVIQPEPLKMTSLQLRKLTFDDAAQMKEKISLRKAVFYSRFRKNRVMYARTMWNSMEYGKFPSISFKEAYFTYMAGKEADGHVFKPWLTSEVRKMD